jgi:hypothetical protein
MHPRCNACQEGGTKKFLTFVDNREFAGSRVRTQRERTSRHWLSLTLFFATRATSLYTHSPRPPLPYSDLHGWFLYGDTSATRDRKPPRRSSLIPGRLERQPCDHLGAWRNSKPWAIMNQGFEGINLPSDLFKVGTMQLSRQCSHGASSGYLNLVPSSTVTKKPRRRRKPDQHGASSTLKPRCPVIVEAFNNLESS